MSIWSDRFQTSGVWAGLKDLGGVLDEASGRPEIGPESTAAIGRLRNVLTFLGKRLELVDPDLATPGPMANLTAAVQNAVGNVRAFMPAGEHAHLVNANALADQALDNLALIGLPFNKSELKGLQAVATQYRDTVISSMGQVRDAAALQRDELTALRSRQAELVAEIAAEKARTAAVVSEFQSQFSQAQADRERVHTEAQNLRQSRFEEFFVEAQSSHMQSQSVRQAKFDDLANDYAKRLAERELTFATDAESLRTAHLAAATTIENNFAVSAKKIVDEMESDKAYVKKLLAVIGTDGVTSGYQKAANEAMARTRIWQLMTVGAMLVLIAIGLVMFFTASGEFKPSELAARVFLAVAVGVLAAYSASQADKYIGAQRRNQKLALELEAIGPYLAPLPQEQQDKFRVELGERTFGKDDPTRDDRSPATSLHLLKSKELREFIIEVVKAAKPG